MSIKPALCILLIKNCIIYVFIERKSWFQANEMRNIDHLAESYDREVAAVASSLTTGVNRFIDVIAGNYSMKTTIGQLVEATNILTDKVSMLP